MSGNGPLLCTRAVAAEQEGGGGLGGYSQPKKIEKGAI